MTEFFQICSAVIICSALLLILSGREKELLSLLTAILFLSVFLFALTRIRDLSALGKEYLPKNLPIQIEPLLKICGIAFGGAAACSICEIFGQKNVGSVLELLTVIEIFLATLPFVNDILQKLVVLFNK